jgi:RES domain-containing protein
VEFKSWRSFWEFEKAVKRERRYVHGAEVKSFLDTVLQTAKTRKDVLPKGFVLWRAQLGCDWEPVIHEGEHIYDEPHPFSKRRMTPRASQAVEGRANPKGIPYLYLASKRDTAMAEVRAWIGSDISVARFKTVREMQIVNVVTDTRQSIVYMKEPIAEKREQCVWKDIDMAFARPISVSDDVADYVPTQIIAELFKGDGFDGIAYRSAVGDGDNIALFYIDTARLISCHLFRTKGMNLEFEESGNPYVVQE